MRTQSLQRKNQKWRQNLSDQVTTGFTSDWLRLRREIFDQSTNVEKDKQCSHRFLLTLTPKLHMVVLSHVLCWAKLS